MLDFYLGLGAGIVLGLVLIFVLNKLLSYSLLHRKKIRIMEILRPPKVFSGTGSNAVELIQFKGADGLELLIPPRLNEINKKKEEKIGASIALFTGENLTGYFNLFTKLLFLFEGKPIFLTIKERDLTKFKRHPNVMISIFKPKSTIENQLRVLEYLFMRRMIPEQEFKKKVSELKIKMANMPETEESYAEYEYVSTPESILKDLEVFSSLVKEHGLAMFTMIDELMLKNSNQALNFLERAVKICAKNRTPIVFTLEEGIAPKNLVNEIKSYCDLIVKTHIKDFKRIVTIYSQNKIIPELDYERVKEDYRKFLKEIGFIEQ